MKTYEATIIFPNSVKEDALQKAVEQVKAEITKLGGAIKDTRMLGRRAFARTLKKQDSGQYVRIDFTLEPGQVTPLLGRFKLNESIFRLQIVAADLAKRNYLKREQPQDEEVAYGIR